MEMEPEEMRRIHIALEQAGSITAAASLLGMTPPTLTRIIEKNPELRSYLPGAKPPTEERAMVRAPLDPGASQDEILAVARQMDEDIEDGFSSLGLGPAAVKEAMAFKKFGQLHFGATRQYIGGGITKLFADLMAEIKSIQSEIKHENNANLDTQRMLREDRSRCVQHAISVYDRVRQTALDAAMIEVKKKEAKEKKKGGKPSFAPLAMTVNGNVEVKEAGEGK